MNHKILFQIAFATFLFAFLAWFSLLVEVFDYLWLSNILEFSFLLGYLLFSIGLYQLNKRMLIPSLMLVIFTFIAFVFYNLGKFGIYNLPITSNFGWTLHSFIFYQTPPLFFLIFLKISNENIKIDDILFIPIILTGIAAFIRILMFLSSEYFENDFFISDLILRYIYLFTKPTSFLVATSIFIWFDSNIAPITQSKKSVIDINKPMTVGNWLLTYLTLIIPIVNIAMPFIWAFSSNTNVHKSTWAKALLIWLAIITALYLIIFVFTIGLMF